MRVKVPHAIFACAVLLVLILIQPVSAQFMQQLPNQPTTTQHPVVPGGASQPDKDSDPMAQHMAAELAKTRNKQRQQQLVSDTAKLLDLATQLKDEVDKSNKDTLSLAVVKKAEEIEKLAKSVKEKMRDAQ